MSDTEPMFVDCGPHGKRVATVICRHLLKRTGDRIGFVENSSDPNDLQAWCYLCEQKFEEESEMSDAFKEFSGTSIVCVICYEDAKNYHSLEQN